MLPAFLEHCAPRVQAKPFWLSNADLPSLGPAEIRGMGVIDHSKNSFTLRANHYQDLHTIDTGMSGTRVRELDLAMGALHVGTSD